MVSQPGPAWPAAHVARLLKQNPSQSNWIGFRLRLLFLGSTFLDHRNSKKFFLKRENVKFFRELGTGGVGDLIPPDLDINEVSLCHFKTKKICIEALWKWPYFSYMKDRNHDTDS